MPRLVYWYGYAGQSLSEAFAFVPETQCISHEEGAASGLRDLPLAIHEKVVAKKRLTTADKLAIRAWEEMKADLTNEDRQPFPRLKEDYERLLDGTMLLAELKGDEE